VLTAFLIKVPVPAVVLASVPAFLTGMYTIQMARNYRRFCRGFNRPVNTWYILLLIVSQPLYQLCLSFAGCVAIIRNIIGKDDWGITEKDLTVLQEMKAREESDELASVSV
jgi:hypothetical protein